MVAAGGIPAVLKSNLRRNAIPMVGAVVGIPIAFNVGKKLLRKPIPTPANRMLKAAGLSGEGMTTQAIQATVSNPVMGKVFTKTATDDVWDGNTLHRQPERSANRHPDAFLVHQSGSIAVRRRLVCMAHSEQRKPDLPTLRLWNEGRVRLLSFLVHPAVHHQP